MGLTFNRKKPKHLLLSILYRASKLFLIPIKNNKPTILHAPSNPPLKGSDFISYTLKKLNNQLSSFNTIITTEKPYREDIHPPYTVSKYKLLYYYNNSNIVIDQIIIGWYGMQTLEALASKNITICKINEDLIGFLPNDCPIITYTKDTDLLPTIKQFHTIEKNKEINQLLNVLFSD